MKRQYLFFTLLFLLMGAVITPIHAQRGINYNFRYDEAGNRISKTFYFDPNAVKESPQEEEEIEPYLDELNKKEIKIYPNPTVGYLAVDITGIEEDTNASIQFYNLDGKIMEERAVKSFRTEFDVSRYAAGTYIMNIQIDGEASSWKIIKK